jgi:hypothetical protein
VANRIELWRPIAVLPVLQKAYMRIISTLLDNTCRELDAMQFGFRAGHQPLEIVDFCRCCLDRCSVWKLPCCFMKCDVARAFDAIRHDVLLVALREAGAPPRLLAALFREFTNVSADINFQGVGVPPVVYSKGGKQGGAETPSLWTRVLDLALRRCRVRWASEKLGIRFAVRESSAWLEGPQKCVNVEGEEYVVYALVWADDIVLCSPSQCKLMRMFQILSEELYAVELNLKPSSLEFLVGGEAFQGAVEEQWPSVWGDLAVRRVPRLCVLGGELDPFGSPVALAEGRVAQAWVHFHSRRAAFSSRHVCLRGRWSRLLETVFRTAAYLAGTYAWHSPSCTVVATMFRKMLMLTLGRFERCDETHDDFIIRMHRKVAELCSLFGMPSVQAQLLKLFAGWMGHLARVGVACPAFFLHTWRDARVMEVLGSSRPRYPTAGRPPFCGAALLGSLLGPFWPSLASARDEWKAASGTVIAGYLRDGEVEVFMGSVGAGGPGPPAGLRPFRALYHISNRSRDMLGLGRLSAPRLVRFVSDCSVAVDAVAGRCIFKEDVLNLNLYRDCVRWYLYMLTVRWSYGRLGGSDLLELVPREQNKDADALVNLVLDCGIEQTMWILPGLADLAPDVPLVVSSDGGLRQSTGEAAAACLIRACPANCPPITIAYWGRRCRVQNSLHAEFEGLIDACRLLVQVSYEAPWVRGFGPGWRPEVA